METYKVPALYRDGLKITQGKAFEIEHVSDEADDDFSDEADDD